MNKVVWLTGFLLSFIVFVMWPAATLAPVAYFMYVYSRNRDTRGLLAAGLWALYGLWEWGMQSRVLCSGECNIRIDLLVFMFLLERLSRNALGLRLD